MCGKNLFWAVLLAVGSFLFVELNYRYWYHFMEQFMLFQTTSGYLSTRLSEPGGMNEYAVEALTILFRYPCGAAMVVAGLLTAIAVCFHGYLRCCGSRAGLWLATLPTLLFLLFPQESMAPLTALLIAVGLAWGYAGLRREWVRYGVGLLMLVVAYLGAAQANLSLALLMALYELFQGEKKKRLLVVLLLLAVGALLPLLLGRLLYVIPLREIYLSKHLCHPEYPIPTALSWIAAAFLAVALVARKITEIERNRFHFWLLAGGIVALFAALLVWRKNPLEQAYRYDWYARQGAWERIVEHVETHPVRDKDALVYLNLALSHTGRLAIDLTRFRQIGVEGFIPHDPRSRLGLIEASEVAWQVGQVNAAQRFAFVGVLSAQRCVQPRLMQRLVDTYLVTGEYRVAEKYIKILEAAPGYRSWAASRRPLLDSAACAATDWVAAKRRWLPITDNPLDLTKTFPNALAFLIDDHADNRSALEYGMAYLLVYKDLDTFMHYMELERKRGVKRFPKLYEEAICLYYAAVRKDMAELRTYPIAPATLDRFSRFVSQARQLPPAALRAEFGDTYYYYAQFVPAPQRTR